MRNYNEIKIHTGQPEYNKGFWNAMKGKVGDNDILSNGYSDATGTYALPSHTDSKLLDAIASKSIFHNIATVHKAYGGASKIFAKDCNDISMFVPENGSIPIFDGMNDFTSKAIENHKLAAFIKLNTSFVYDAMFDIESYLVNRLAKNFAYGEDRAFITGTGVDEPAGILHDTNGAEVALTANSLTYDNVTSLYFSIKPEYHKNAVWLMNDKTALSLRTLKDSSGNYLWRDSDDTILGKKVVISEFMKDEKPIAFGDFNYYWVIERSPVTIKPIVEKFLLNEQIGYLAFEFLDGKLIRKDAIKVIAVSKG